MSTTSRESGPRLCKCHGEPVVSGGRCRIKRRASKRNSHRLAKAAKRELVEAEIQKPCIMCGLIDPVAAELHHPDGNDLDTSPQSMISNTKWTIAQVRRELDHVVTLCSNCHGKIHYNPCADECGSPNRRKMVSMLDSALADGCSECGEIDVRTLVFHHRDPSLKKFDVSRARSPRSHMSMGQFLPEFAKCDVLCRNCHRYAHA